MAPHSAQLTRNSKPHCTLMVLGNSLMIIVSNYFFGYCPFLIFFSFIYFFLLYYWGYFGFLSPLKFIFSLKATKFEGNE